MSRRGRIFCLVIGMRASSLIAVMRRKPTPFIVERALRRLAGADDIRASGDCGRIIGSIHDHAVLERYAQTRTWCPVENQFFVDFFAHRAGGTYLDIGANIGLTTIPVARNPAVSCLAFEPEPRNFAYLQENVRTHCRGGNVRLFQLALFDHAGDLEFRLSPTNKGDHRIHAARQGGDLDDAAWPVIHVEAQRLDDIAIDRQIVPPLAAKVIAQGSELHILAGGRNTLCRAEILVLEFYPYLLAQAGADWNFFHRFLASNFADAALTVGGQRTEPCWQPVADIIEGLRQLMRTAAERADLYFHVFLCKQ
jgi:FkbM family methyltransferase